MPKGAIYVGRPTRWGNLWKGSNERGRVTVVRLFREYLDDLAPEKRAALLEPLRGRDLACWCALDQPCHADVLLELANRAEWGRGE